MKSVWVCDVYLDTGGFSSHSCTEHRSEANCLARVECLVKWTAKLTGKGPEEIRKLLTISISQVDWDQAPVGPLAFENETWRLQLVTFDPDGVSWSITTP